MKQVFLKFTGKKFISAAFLTATVLLSTVNVNAAKHASYKIVSGDKATIQYTGTAADGVMLKMHVENENSAEFTLTIKNEFDEVLFSQSFTDKDFTKQFKLLKTSTESNVYYFTISSKNKEFEQKYVVNASTKAVEDVSINKL